MDTMSFKKINKKLLVSAVEQELNTSKHAIIRK